LSQPNPKKKKKSGKAAGISPVAQNHLAGVTGQPAPASAVTTGSDTQVATAVPAQRAKGSTYQAAQVEEVEDE